MENIRKAIADAGFGNNTLTFATGKVLYSFFQNIKTVMVHLAILKTNL